MSKIRMLSSSDYVQFALRRVVYEKVVRNLRRLGYVGPNSDVWQ